MPIENQPPQLAQPIADQLAGENNAFSFTLPAGTFSDADAGDSLLYSATLADGTPLPAWLTFDAQTGSFSGTPGTGDIGTLSVLVQATDSQGASASDVFDINVAQTLFMGTLDNDTLIGTAFNDSLASGGAGDDVYLPGTGMDSIFEFGGGSDELRLAAGIDPDQVERIRFDGSNDLVLRAVGSTDQVTIFNWFGGPESQIEHVVFGDGTVWDAATTASLRRIGTEGADFLQGSFSFGGLLDGRGGDDVLLGGSGNDTLDGGAGNDALGGADGDDVYLPGAGMDMIFDFGGSDELRFAAGIDPNQVERFRPDGGNDLVLRAAGSTDEVTIFNWFGGPENQIERVVFGDGTVWDAATTASLRRIGTEGADFLQGSFSFGGLLDGRGGDDVLLGGSGNDTLDGGAGNDALGGADGDDVYLPGAGMDMIFDFGGLDELRFAAGIDPNQVERFRPDGGNDLVLRAAGSTDEVTIFNWFGGPENQIERVVFGDGTVWDAATSAQLRRIGTEGADFLQGSFSFGGLLDGRGGDDTLIGGSGNDTMDGGAGNDFLAGQDGDDVYLPGTGMDSIFEFGGSDELRLAAGISPDQVERIRFDGSNDLVLRAVGSTDQVTIFNWFGGPENQIERVVFGDGTVWDPATSSQLRRIGTEGNDFLQGSFSFGGLLDGRGGDDTLIGGSGNDTMDGGAGNDFVAGQDGDDVYLPGTGMDSIFEFGGSDELRLAAGIDSNQVERIRPDGSNDLVLRAVGSTDQVTIFNWFGGPENQIERVVFADGMLWDVPTTGSLRRIGTEDSDFLQGSFTFGGLLDGRGGDDTLIGGSGSDTLDGGAGNDFLAGQDGDDLYLAGSGMDSIFEFGGNDELRFAAGIDPNQVERFRPGGSNDLILHAVGSTDLVTISNWFGGPENQIERVVFADGTVWSPATTSGLNQAPSVANPIADQSVAENAVFNFVVPPSTFSDPDIGDAFTLSATLATGAPLPAWLSFNPDEKTFSGTPTTADTGILSIRLTATDLSGASASDVFNIGVGDANLPPTVANPITDQFTAENAFFSFSVPAGTFADPNAGDALTLSARQVGGTPLPAWLSFDAATATFSGTPPAGSSGTLDVEIVATDRGGLSASDQFGVAIGPEQIVINGTPGNDLLIGTPGSDQIWAGDGNDEVWGLEGDDFISADFTFTPGDDTVYGGAGSDFIYGGGGTDLLIGGTGNDVYEFLSGSTVVVEYAGEGHDEIHVSESYALPANVEDLYLNGLAIQGTGNELDNKIGGTPGNNVIDGGAGADFMYGQSGDDLFIVDNVDDFVLESPGEGNDTIQSSVTYSLDSIHPLDHQVENLVLTGTAAIDATGNALDNVLTGNSAANVLSGGGGNDLLDGGDGDDTLIGGSGSDVLVGGAGADTYVFSAADDTGNTAYIGPGDRVQLPGLSRSSVLMTRDESNLYITVNDTGASIILRSASGLPGEEGWRTTLEFGDGSVWLPENVVNTSPYVGTNLDDVLNGSEFGDQIFGVRGNDVIHGNDGNDVLYGGGNLNFSSPDGDDLLDGGSGRDTMYGGGGNDRYVVDDVGDQVFEDAAAGIDTIESSVGYVLGAGLENLTLTGTAPNGSGNETQNVLLGNAVANTLSGNGGDDALFGMEGNDLLFGGAGNDQLSGGDGSDSLYGEAGDDVLESGAGHDEMQGGAGNDTYLYARGSGFDVVWEFLGTAADTDIVLLGADIAPSDISVRYTRPTQQFFNDGGFLLTVNGGSDVLKLVWSPTTGRDIEVEEVRFANGTAWDETVLAAMAIQNGDAPALVTALADQSATEDAPFTYEVPANAFDDIDIAIGDSLAYSAGLADGSALPAWLAFDAATRTFSGSPANGDVGAISVRVTATDESGRSASDVFDLTVVNTNDAPLAAADSVAVAEDATTDNLTAALLANDTDVDTGDSRTITSVDTTGTVGTVVFDALTQTLTYSADAASQDSLGAGQSATDTFSYTVTDAAGATSTASVTVTVTGVNDAPVLVTPIADLVAPENNAFSFTLPAGTFADIDAGDTLVYGVGFSVPAAWLSFDPVTLTLSGTPGAADRGSFSVFVQAFDRHNGFASDVFDINVPQTVFVGTNGNDVLVGTDFNDSISGLGGNDLLDGGAGADTLTGGSGDDEYIVDNAGDQVIENSQAAGNDLVRASLSWTLGSGIERLTLTGSASIDGTGNSLNNELRGNDAANVLAGLQGSDVLIGGGGADTLDGGTGSDTMVGGTGDDTYVVAQTGDVTTENADEGTDIVQSSITWTLAQNIEYLFLTGSTAINGTGNALDNGILGNAADNVLNGGGGVDTLVGGLGNDTYVVDVAGETIFENFNEGIDTVQSSVTWVLDANLENLTLTGTAAINGTGNGFDNVLTGNSANNILTGGAGNDTYVVGQAGDVTIENANQGIDTVQSSITWTLGANLENLTLTGTAAINGTGNALDNVLTGNSGNNILTGRAGNDTYVVSTGDVPTENANEGIDTVRSSGHWTLGNNLENLVLTGAASANGTGNALANSITGNSGNNVLNGGGGADTLIGGLGNDTYVVDVAGDSITENANEGTDTVQSSITWTLGASLENLVLTGSAAVNGTGNALNNALTGNARDNTLDGRGGADTLTGDTGNDTYLFGRGYGADRIQEGGVTYGNADIAQFLAGVERDQIWFQRSGNDLVASIIGTADKLTVQNWYSVGGQVEQFRTADGSTLLESNVQNLVNAMAAFAPPAPGQETLPPDYADALNPVIAANWQ